MRTRYRLAFQPLTLRWIVLGAVLCLLLAALPAAAQEPPAVVRSDPAVIELAPGQTATVSVVLAEARDVYGIDVRATFDPQLVEVVDADPAREGVQFTPGAFPQPDFLVRNEADNQAGALHYAITQVSPSEPVSGNGLVFTVQLRARAGSGEGSFAITAVELSDRDGILLPVQPQSALIRVAAGSPGAPPAEPTAANPPPATPPATATPAAANPPAATPPPATATPTAANPPAATPSPPAAAPAVASPSAPSAASPTAGAAAPAAAAVAPSLEPTGAAVQQPVDPAQDAPAAQPAVDASAGPDAANLAAPPVTPQAVAAAPAAENAAPDAAPEALAPAAPAGAQPDALGALPQRPSESREAGDQRSPAFDPSNLLLIVGIFAFMAAAVLGISLVVVLRR